MFQTAEGIPLADEISLHAYHIYLQRNGAPGNPFDDWMQAEQELLSGRSQIRTTFPFPAFNQRIH